MDFNLPGPARTAPTTSLAVFLIFTFTSSPYSPPQPWQQLSRHCRALRLSLLWQFHWSFS